MPEIKSTDLQLNQPVEASNPDSSLIIKMDAASPLSTGTYLFQLQVLDDSGNNSQPTNVKIVVVDDQAPNAIVDAPGRVSFGQGFILSGKRSFDVGGTISRYVWTLIQAP